MKDIKTKECKKDIKVIDKSGNLAKAIKKTALRAKDKIENVADDGQITPDEYANDKIKYMAESTAKDTAKAGKAVTRKSYNTGKKVYRNIKQRRIKKAAENIKNETVKTASNTANRTIKTQKHTVKTAKYTIKKSIKTSRETAKNAKRTAQAAKKTAQATAKASKAAAQAARQTAKATYKAVVAVTKATIAAVKAIVAAIGKLIAAIAAGGWVAVLVIVIICFIALVVGSCFGIFFSNETGTEGKPLYEVVTTLNTEFQTEITDIQNSVSYDDFEITSNDGLTSVNWEDVLSVFAVKTTTGDNAQNVACLTDDKIAELREIMWDMNALSDSIRTESKQVVVTNADATTQTQTISRTILTVTITHKDYIEMINEYSFNSTQQEQLYLMKDEKYATLWGELLGGYSGGNGEILNGNTNIVSIGIFSWPFEEKGTITSYFGYRTDPISGKVDYHCGTDIAMPNGTPILAAADGDVTIANSTDSWGGSYGYYVKIKHSDSFDTLYAHCSKICVITGQEVKKGQVIAYVGSTGRSTGNHLHFEVWNDGVRTNALDYFD